MSFISGLEIDIQGELFDVRDMPPSLTIAIPTLDRQKLFSRALDSALAQTLPVDIVVSDNGSTDGTAAYLDSMALPSRARLFRHARTIPIQDHAAFLVSQIQTEWAVFLSDDDYLEPEFAERLVGLIEERPDVALVYTGCRFHFAEVLVPANVGPRFEPAAEFLFEFLNNQRNICMCATAFRISDMRSIGPAPQASLIGDMYYWVRILGSGGVVGCAGDILSNYSVYRPGEQSQTSGISADAWARESTQLITLLCDTILSSPANRRNSLDVKRVSARYLAHTTSTQLVWIALRDARKLALLWSFCRLVGLLRGDNAALIRAFAAIVLPRGILEWLALSRARQRARVQVNR